MDRWSQNMAEVKWQKKVQKHFNSGFKALILERNQQEILQQPKPQYFNGKFKDEAVSCNEWQIETAVQGMLKVS